MSAPPTFGPPTGRLTPEERAAARAAMRALFPHGGRGSAAETRNPAVDFDGIARSRDHAATTDRLPATDQD
jgi:hypothetical protein